MVGHVGLVVHPRRDVDAALRTVLEWASKHGMAVGQVRIPGQSRTIAEPVDVASCDLVIALGGDGTALAALHAAAPPSRPVLGIACGSIGVLTSVDSERLESALEQVAAGDWIPQRLPGLDVSVAGADVAVAINDVAVVRNGAGQVIIEIRVEDELYARTAGDGLIVATPLGSSAYTMAAGGPIVLPQVPSMVLTPLAHHGGVSPPLVVGPESRIELLIESGYGGSRIEVDGQLVAERALDATVSLRDGYATMVTLADQEPLLSGLRRRRLLVDSPRVLARAARAGATRARGTPSQSSPTSSDPT
jgi:NAD+ kinase